MLLYYQSHLIMCRPYEDSTEEGNGHDKGQIRSGHWLVFRASILAGAKQSPCRYVHLVGRTMRSYENKKADREIHSEGRWRPVLQEGPCMGRDKMSRSKRVNQESRPKASFPVSQSVPQNTSYISTFTLPPSKPLLRPRTITPGAKPLTTDWRRAILKSHD